MTDFDEFERRLALALRADADEGAVGFDPAHVARAAIAAARPPVRLAPRQWTRPMLARLAFAAAVGALTVAAGLYVAVGGPSRSPAIASPSASSVTARPASWVLTGDMTTPRMQQTATRLLDGRVLVVGGNSAGPEPMAERTAELYNPATRTWTATGGMIQDRLQGHTATLLPDGKVLVAGGRGAPGETIVVLASAELYDPATGTWTETGSMAVPRIDHTATLLPNGKVLVAGGGDGTHALASAELYDPATGRWTATGSMLNPGGGTATLLPDGKVLVGGIADSGASSSAELYDPATGTWAATGSMTTLSHSYAATLLPNGKVLVAGGFVDLGHASASAELYDPATGTWTTTGNMTTARIWPMATLLSDGHVLVMGGATGLSPVGDTILSSAELYDPGTGTWTATAGMAEVRELFTATLLTDGTVLVAGGKGGTRTQPPHDPLASAELYVPGSP